MNTSALVELFPTAVFAHLLGWWRSLNADSCEAPTQVRFVRYHINILLTTNKKAKQAQTIG